MATGSYLNTGIGAAGSIGARRARATRKQVREEETSNLRNSESLCGTSSSPVPYFGIVALYSYPARRFTYYFIYIYIDRCIYYSGSKLGGEDTRWSIGYAETFSIWISFVPSARSLLPLSLRFAVQASGNVALVVDVPQPTLRPPPPNFYPRGERIYPL